MYKYASPKNFYRLAGQLLPWLTGLTAVLLLAGAVSRPVRRAAGLPAG